MIEDHYFSIHLKDVVVHSKGVSLTAQIKMVTVPLLFVEHNYRWRAVRVVVAIASLIGGSTILLSMDREEDCQQNCCLPSLMN